jgi:flagellin-specific chaperone FliS
MFRLWLLEKKHSRSVSKLNKATELLKYLELKLEREGEGQDLATSLAELRRNLYRHGYYRGKKVPETLDADDKLYVRCERAYNRILGSRLRKKFQKDPD